MDNDIYLHKCYAIVKTNDHTRCKSISRHNSIFCSIHKKYKPKYVAVILEDNNNGNDNNNIISTTWTNIPYTNEIDVKIKIQNIKDEIEKAKLDKIVKEIDKLNSITTCKVCGDSVTNNSDLIRCCKATSTNEHLVCNLCLIRHISILVADGIGSYTCMFNNSDKCGGEYTENDIKKVIIINNPNPINSTTKQLQWDELVNISIINKMASICDDYVICPLCCKWGCIFEIPAGFQGHVYIPCEKCGDNWCNFCKRKSHGDRSCYQLEFYNDEPNEKRIEVIDRMLQEIITKALTHCCSTCGSVYIKEEGCNLMMCPKCDSMTCYLCNMKLYYKNNTKYWHFVGHDLSDPDAQCKLWNNNAGDGKANQGNTELNLNAIKNNLLNFIKSNITDNLYVLICERIIYILKDDKEYADIVKLFENFNI